jgi:creatinine amidohydrolase
MKNTCHLLCLSILICGIILPARSQTHDAPLLLTEMTWVDVQSYLEINDMVIIPLGSIEQHGPHLPEGADILGAIELSERISARTNVLVAPILMVGYSEYHSGFPGTLSISPETMEQVVFECVESLIKHGFKKFLFFNAHGGNNIVQDNLIHRIGHTTGAIAISIGVGSPLWPPKGIENYDWHAGKFETSLDLCLFPDLVQLDKAEKPIMYSTPELEELKSLSDNHPELKPIWESMLFLPEETGKGSATHQMTSNGVYSYNDPKDASVEYGQQFVDEIVNKAVDLIEAWKMAN